MQKFGEICKGAPLHESAIRVVGGKAVNCTIGSFVFETAAAQQQADELVGTINVPAPRTEAVVTRVA